MATKLPKPPAKEAAAIEARAKAAGRKPKDMQAAIAKTYAANQARQALASKVSIPKGETMMPAGMSPGGSPGMDVAQRRAQTQATSALDSSRGPRMAAAASIAHPPQTGAVAARSERMRRARMPRPPAAGDIPGLPADATAEEKAAWQKWWNDRPKRGSSTPVTPPTGGAS